MKTTIDYSELLESIDYKKVTQEMFHIIQWVYQKGWSPATSTNFSFRNLSPFENIFTISQSGKDKGNFSINDFMLINQKGKAVEGFEQFKPSAETLLHTLLYENSEVNFVLHTHSVYATVLSQKFQKDKKLSLSNYEVLKAFPNIYTHQTTIEIPIFGNSQDMQFLNLEIKAFQKEKPDMFAFLLAGHGLYTWGNTLSNAKKYLEALEFLLECEYHLQVLKNI